MVCMSQSRMNDSGVVAVCFNSRRESRAAVVVVGCKSQVRVLGGLDEAGPC